MTLNDHLAAYPRGRRYSYAVRVRGIPGAFTDGKVDWGTFASTRWGTAAYPYLAKSDWQFKFEANPLEPLNVGTGISIDLLRDPAGFVAGLFAPAAVPLELIIDEGSLSPSTSSFDVDNGALTSAGDVLHWGLEAMRVLLVSSNTLTVERGFLGSPRRRSQEINSAASLTLLEGSDGLVPMEPLTDVPTLWKGRYVDVLMGVIEDDDTLGDTFPIWAGRLESFSFSGKNIKLAVDPLTACLTKDSWPRALPKASMKGDTMRFFLTQEDLILRVSAINAAGTAIDDSNPYPLGSYGTGVNPTFTVYTANVAGEWMTLDLLGRLVQDTIIYAIRTSPGSGSAYDNTLFNNFAITVVREDNNEHTWLTLAYRNDTNIDVIVSTNSGVFFKLMVTQFVNGLSVPAVREMLPRFSSGTFGSFGEAAGFILDTYGSQIGCYPSDPSRPFDENRGGCYQYANGTRGFVKISEGDESELISFSSGGYGQDQAFYLEVFERGLGGTRQRAWGGTAEETTVEQVAAVYVGEPMPLASLILYLLLSGAADALPGPNGNYDFLGEWIGLGVPDDLVDREGIIARLAATDLPRPTLFWVEEAGKGKDAVEQLLLANGVYFVTRRFTRDGVEKFGLSVDVVDLPVTTQYNHELTDSEILASSRPSVDVNERLIINHISLAPRYHFGQDTGDTGGKRYAYASKSIAKYGQAKTLELEPSAFYNLFSSAFGGTYHRDSDIATAIVSAVGLRWFGAYSSGNYTLSANTPHIGWKYQTGDRVLVTLTGVPNPDGSDSYIGVPAKVMDASHTHGSGANAKVVLRLSVVTIAELAPNFMVDASGYGPGYINIKPNAFSGNSQNGYFLPGTDDSSTAYPPPFGQPGPVTDGMWFDPANHPLNLVVRIWDRGNYAGYQDFVVTGLSDNVLSIVGTLSISPVNQLIGTFGGAYNADSDTVRKQYAHLGSNETKSLLGSLDGMTDRAKKWM